MNNLNDNQKLVVNWIKDKLNLPVYADGYLGAIIQLKNKNSGYITYIAHLCRDLINGLAHEYKGIKRTQTNYRNHVERINVMWDKRWSSFDNTINIDQRSYFEIPLEVCDEITVMVNSHKEATIRSKENEIVFFSTFLDYQDQDAIPENFLIEWSKAKKIFNKLAHFRKKPIRGIDERELIDSFHVLEKYLFTAAKSRYQRLRRLDEILDETN